MKMQNEEEEKGVLSELRLAQQNSFYKKQNFTKYRIQVLDSRQVYGCDFFLIWDAYS